MPSPTVAEGHSRLTTSTIEKVSIMLPLQQVYWHVGEGVEKSSLSSMRIRQQLTCDSTVIHTGKYNSRGHCYKLATRRGYLEL